MDKKSHDSVFGDWIVRDAADTVYCFNLLKASKRAFTNQLEAMEEDARTKLIDKPITCCHFWQLGMLCGLQIFRNGIDERYTRRLNKFAPPNLVVEVENFFRSFMGKAVRFYWAETDGGEIELPQRKREAFFKKIAVEKGLRPNKAPFQP